MRRVTYEVSKILRSFGVVFDTSKNEQIAKLKKSLRLLKNSRIEFYIEQYPDGTWLAESTNVDGIATGGDNPRLISDSLKDAVMTYYEVPALYYDSVNLRSDNEPVTVQQKVHVGA